MMGTVILVAVYLFYLALFGTTAFFLAKGIANASSAVAYRLLKRRPPAAELHVASAACALFLMIFLPMRGCNYLQGEAYRKAVPPQFDLVEIVYHDEMSDLREGCGVAVFRLSDANLARIRSEGLTYFESARLGRDGDSYHQYQPWRATPAAQHDNLLRGVHCVDDEPKLLMQVRQAIDEEGAFFTTGPEQDLVVIPSLGVLVFSYNG
jgi:hypothetical protein